MLVGNLDSRDCYVLKMLAMCLKAVLLSRMDTITKYLAEMNINTY